MFVLRTIVRISLCIYSIKIKLMIIIIMICTILYTFLYKNTITHDYIYDPYNCTYIAGPFYIYFLIVIMMILIVSTIVRTFQDIYFIKITSIIMIFVIRTIVRILPYI